jgi:hypothetical protein
MGIYFHTLLLLLLLLLPCPWLEISGADKDGMWTLDGHPLEFTDYARKTDSTTDYERKTSDSF